MDGQANSSAEGRPQKGGSDAERIEAIADEVLARRAAGEALPDELLKATYADLWPQLAEALALRRHIRRQILEARKVGPRRELIEPMSASRIDDPLDLPEVIAAATDPHTAIEGYRMQGEISRGGQAAVFLAVQESTERKVAIKVMSGGPYITSRNRARFEREAKILATLKHPAIVGIVDRGRTADGSFFIVMEYIDGQALDEYLDACRRRQCPQRQILALFARIAEAVDEAHRHRIVHRDIKPSNIRVDERGQPHVLDFGLAHLTSLDELEYGGNRVTVTGHVVGSLPWASPEQALGDVGRMGPASDVYSLGIVLYQALTGRYPYPAFGTVHEVTQNICRAAPLPPDQIADAPFGRIDAKLGQILLKALAKDPARRYWTAGAVAEDLTAYLEGRPASVRPRRHWWRPAREALVLVLLLASALSWILADQLKTYGLPVIELQRLPRNSVGMELVLLPSGQFGMGSPANEPGHQTDEVLHTVTITHPFYMGCTEVTRGQYRDVMGRLPEGLNGKGDDLPIDLVSYNDAEEFCRLLSDREHRRYRLPTEAEWEYACRGGTPTEVGGTGRIDEMGWYDGSSAGRVHPVGRKAPNHWGLYDMHGNVWEWCSDGYVEQLGTESAADPWHRPDGSGYVRRGGGIAAPADQCRAASRSSLPSASARYPLVGFRVVVDATPAGIPAAVSGEAK